MTASISIATSDGSFNAYYAPPKESAAPAIVMLQEIFGVNESMRQVARDFAAKGYHVIVPDLFWRQKPGVELDPAKDREAAAGYMQGLDPAKAAADCQTAITAARKLEGASGKVAVIGFCLGGRLAYVLAAKSDADAAIAYYGVGLETMLDLMAEMRAPLLLHIGGADPLCPPDKQAAIMEEVKKTPDVYAYVYDGARHAFRRPQGDGYKADAAVLADQRTADFLKTHLAS